MRARQREESDDDEGEAENDAEFGALVIEQRAYADRCNHQAQGLGECDGAVLGGAEAEGGREVGQNGTQHGGDHSIDEDGEDGGKDQHAGA